MKLFSPLNQVDNAVEDYELFPRPWLETAGTIQPNGISWHGNAKPKPHKGTVGVKSLLIIAAGCASAWAIGDHFSVTCQYVVARAGFGLPSVCTCNPKSPASGSD